jgi:hypothetical protein
MRTGAPYESGIDLNNVNEVNQEIEENINNFKQQFTKYTVIRTNAQKYQGIKKEVKAVCFGKDGVFRKILAKHSMSGAKLPVTITVRVIYDFPPDTPDKKFITAHFEGDFIYDFDLIGGDYDDIEEIVINSKDP